MLIYDRKFLNLNVNTLNNLSVEEFISICGREHEIESKCVYNAISEKDVYEFLRATVLILDWATASKIARNVEGYNAEALLENYKVFLLDASNKKYLTARRKAYALMQEAMAEPRLASMKKAAFIYKFGKAKIKLAATLFDSLMYYQSELGNSSRLLYSEATGYQFTGMKTVEDALDSLFEYQAVSPATIRCCEVKSSLNNFVSFSQQYDSDVDNRLLNLLYTSLNNTQYVPFLKSIGRDDWVHSTHYLSQSTLILLFDLYNRFHKGEENVSDK